MREKEKSIGKISESVDLLITFLRNWFFDLWRWKSINAESLKFSLKQDLYVLMEQLGSQMFNIS